MNKRIRKKLFKRYWKNNLKSLYTIFDVVVKATYTRSLIKIAFGLDDKNNKVVQDKKN